MHKIRANLYLSEALDFHEESNAWIPTENE